MKRKPNCLATILFLIYLALLVWIILFKLQFSISDLDKVRSINLIPFHYDKEVGAAFHLTEVLENFLIFVPMGIYLQMLLLRTKLYVKFMLIAVPPVLSVAQTTILYDCSAHRPFGLRQLLHPDSPTAFSNSN